MRLRSNLTLKAIVITLGFTLLLSGCAGSGTQYPPTIPFAPQQTAVTTATAEATAISDSGTPQSGTPQTSGGAASELEFTSRDGRLRLRYPAGWVIREDEAGQVFIANNNAAMSGTPLSGEYQINIVPAPVAIVTSDSPTTTPMTLRETLDQLIGGFQTAGTGVTISEPIEQPFAGRAAVYVNITDTDANTESLLLVFDPGSNLPIALAAVAVLGELENVQPVIRGVVASVSYQ
jgi:hypothetical protein